ncbi:MAG TPA: hypothetical protein PJ991_07805 [Kiritimatiellia bacterium]|nr:hypothetical protein [Kiritimatiellia bacterium]
MKSKRFSAIILIFAILLVFGTYFILQSVNELKNPRSDNSVSVYNGMHYESGGDSAEQINSEATQSDDSTDVTLPNRVISSIESDVAVSETSISAPDRTASTNNVMAEASAVLSERVGIASSPVAAHWAQTMGTTIADIEIAQVRMKEGGFSGSLLDDPTLVRQFLPRRNVSAVNIHAIKIAERASHGQPVPFTLAGALPDASFQFTRFEITRKDDVIRIVAIGDSTGEVVPGVEIPIELEGEIDPLPPGTYLIEFPGLDPENFYQLIID